MAPDNNGLKIIRSWPGPGTCDTFWETEDGRVWVNKSSSMGSDGGTTIGTSGRVVGNRMMVGPPYVR